MPEEKMHVEEMAREEETAAGEIIQREENAEEAVKKEVSEEEKDQKEEKRREAGQKEEHIGESDGEEKEAVEEEQEETVVWEEAEEEVMEEEASEEIVYTEGENMEDMAEQEYRSVEDNRLDPELFEEAPKKRGFFRRSKEEAHFLRDKWILSRIRDEDLMDYLVLEQKRHEELQKAKDIRDKRMISAFKLTVSLAAGVAVVYLLKDNPTIFVNILYIGGILGGFWFWKNSHEK